jgi:hypothetical protein
MKNLVFGVAVSALAFGAFPNTESPYVGQETREINRCLNKRLKIILTAIVSAMAKRPN